MKNYDGKQFQNVDMDTCITKVCMKNYDGKPFQLVDRIRAL